MVIAGQGRWEVTDRITGGGVHNIESFIHLHPSLAVSRSGAREVTARHAGGAAIRIRIDEGCSIREEAGWYCPQFGSRVGNRVIVLETRTALPKTLRYVIERL